MLDNELLVNKYNNKLNSYAAMFYIVHSFMYFTPF